MCLSTLFIAALLTLQLDGAVEAVAAPAEGRAAPAALLAETFAPTLVFHPDQKGEPRKGSTPKRS